MSTVEFDEAVRTELTELGINPDLVGAHRAPQPTWIVTLGNGRVSVSFTMEHEDVGHVVKAALSTTLHRASRRLLEALLGGL